MHKKFVLGKLISENVLLFGAKLEVWGSIWKKLSSRNRKKTIVVSGEHIILYMSPNGIK